MIGLAAAIEAQTDVVAAAIRAIRVLGTAIRSIRVVAAAIRAIQVGVSHSP